jgi:hypothetical protein
MLEEVRAERRDLESERDQARADLAQAVEDRERLRGENERLRADLALYMNAGNEACLALEAELIRLRAVLDMSYDEMVDLATNAGLGHLTGTDCKAFLAALRARAELEPTP